MNPFRSRTLRTIILTFAGLGLTWTLAVIVTPIWPEFCDDTIVGAPCDEVARQTAWGYLTVALGVATAILGPIGGSLIDLWLNGANWETPRGRETVITNMPLLVGAAFLAIGVLLVASA